MIDATSESLDRQVRVAAMWAGLSSLGAAIMMVAAETSMDEAIANISMVACIVLASVAVFAIISAVIRHRRRSDYRGYVQSLSSLQREMDPEVIRRDWNTIYSNARDPLFKRLIELRRPVIERQLEVAEDAVMKTHRQEKLKERLKAMRGDVIARIAYARANHPKLLARDAAIGKLTYVKARRSQLDADVDKVLKAASWWQKLNYDYPDCRQLDRDIIRLEFEVKNFLAVNGRAISTAETKLDQAEAYALERMKTCEANAISAIPASHKTPCDEVAIARNALLLGALSVPVSAWNDVAQADEVYNSLRLVSGGYANMNDFEIWLQCLTMSPESLAGLAALTKGALFEAHVASDTGGILHEHFNTPDTDIVIDGTAFQIKATDSEDYIESVDPAIPVIATSEVAAATGAIDGGMSNADLDTATSLALGGTVVDGMDTMVDAALSGLGGLGIIATLRGINHAIDRHREGMDKLEAIEEGIGVAVTGSLKATVDLAEMGYKVAASRPSRFAGRQVVKVLARIDRSLDGDEDANDPANSPQPRD